MKLQLILLFSFCSLNLNGFADGSDIFFVVTEPAFQNKYNPSYKLKIRNIIIEELETHIRTLCPMTIKAFKGYNENGITLRPDDKKVMIYSLISGDPFHIKVVFRAEVTKGVLSAGNKDELYLDDPDLASDLNGKSLFKNMISSTIDGFLDQSQTKNVFNDLSFEDNCFGKNQTEPNNTLDDSLALLKSNNSIMLEISLFDTFQISPNKMLIYNNTKDSIIFDVGLTGEKDDFLIKGQKLLSKDTCQVCILKHGNYVLNIRLDEHIQDDYEFFVKKPKDQKIREYMFYGGVGSAIFGVVVEKFISEPLYDRYLTSDNIMNYNKANDWHHVGFISFWTGLTSALTSAIWHIIIKGNEKKNCKRVKFNLAPHNNPSLSNSTFRAVVNYVF